MTPDKVQTIMSKVEYASTWYGMYEEKLEQTKGTGDYLKTFTKEH